MPARGVGVVYPSPPLNMVAGNLLEIGDYDKAMEIGEQRYGPVPYCDARCHIGCYTEGSTAISHPAEGVREALRHLLPRARKLPPLTRPERLHGASLPPPFAELRALPSLPPDAIRQLRRADRLENDWTSRVCIKGAEPFLPLVELTREPALAAP